MSSVPQHELDALGRAMGRRLAAGEPVEDEALDLLLGERSRECSRQHWTSIEVARTAARLFERAGAQRVLDIGSGAGKFCAVASLVTGRRVFGVERRPGLVQESRELARRLGADVEVIEGGLGAVDPSRFDGFYAFNPFGEYVAADEDRYDDAFPRTFAGYILDARTVERWLLDAKVGTALVTYNGLGGRIPSCFEVQASETLRKNVLRLWVKTQPASGTRAVLEVEDELIDAEALAAMAKRGAAAFDDSPLVAALATPPDDVP
jgi:SAM-dependent methyltransferase